MFPGVCVCVCDSSNTEFSPQTLFSTTSCLFSMNLFFLTNVFNLEQFIHKMKFKLWLDHLVLSHLTPESLCVPESPSETGSSLPTVHEMAQLWLSVYFWAGPPISDTCDVLFIEKKCLETEGYALLLLPMNDITASGEDPARSASTHLFSYLEDTKEKWSLTMYVNVLGKFGTGKNALLLKKSNQAPKEILDSSVA